jgi:hypothetical protein
MHAHRRFALLVTSLAIATACGGDHSVTDPGETAPPPPAQVRLKEIAIDRLPSPFYHFDYDATGRVAAASYASGLTSYTVSYLGDRILEMKNIAVANGDRLVYAYDTDGRVAGVRYVNASGETFTRVFYTYEGGKLTGVERSRAVAGGFIIDKTIALTYWPDGNLAQLAERRPKIDGLQEETNGVVSFEQYDTGINVDGFGLIHDDFFDHFVLLPGVVLQKNNPRRETRTGDGVTYVVDYTYAYDGAGRPATKSGDLAITGGGEVGLHVQTRSEFSYY